MKLACADFTFPLLPHDRVLDLISMLEFDISDDAKEVVYSTQPPDKVVQLWIAALDRSSPPQLISASGEDWARISVVLLP